MDSFNIYALMALANAVATFAIGLFIFLQGRKKRPNATFFLLTITVTIWSFAYYGWQVADTASEALFWTRYLMAGAIFIPVTYIHFIVSFLGLIKKYKRSIILSYLILI